MTEKATEPLFYVLAIEERIALHETRAPESWSCIIWGKNMVQKPSKVNHTKDLNLLKKRV